MAAHDAVQQLLRSGQLVRSPLLQPVAAVSVGLLRGLALLDLDYDEDSACDTDMNVVMTGAGHFVEVQGTAEGQPFSHEQMSQMLRLAESGITELIALQRAAVAAPVPGLASQQP